MSIFNQPATQPSSRATTKKPGLRNTMIHQLLDELVLTGEVNIAGLSQPQHLFTSLRLFDDLGDLCTGL